MSLIQPHTPQRTLGHSRSEIKVLTSQSVSLWSGRLTFVAVDDPAKPLSLSLMKWDSTLPEVPIKLRIYELLLNSLVKLAKIC